MSDITTPRDLFLHELGDILYVEQELAETSLPKLIDEVQDREFKKGLEKHLKQTVQHAKNVEKVFGLLGEKPKAETCIGFEGLKKEQEKMAEEATGDLIDLVNTGAAARTEHYEIAAYQALITMARTLKQPKAVELLDRNLKDEKETLREVEKLGRRLTKERARELQPV